MEQHPIPQDVTGFQFKLIGSMTVKQFGFVAVGVILAVVLYYLPLHFPLSFMVKLILIPLFGGSGVVIAFVPIEGRPVDVMATNFFNAIFSPNQYVYHKQGRHFSFNSITISKPIVAATAAKANTPQKSKIAPASKQQQLQQLLNAESGHTRNKLDEKEMSFLKSITSLPTQPVVSGFKSVQTAASNMMPTAPLTPPKILSAQEEKPLPKPPHADMVAPKATPPSQPAAKPEDKEQNLVQQEASLEKQLDEAKKREAQTDPQIAAQAHQKVIELENQIQNIHAEKSKLEQEVIELRKQLNNVQQPVQQAIAPAPMPTQPIQTPPAPTPPPAGPKQDAEHVRNVPQNMSKKVGLPHVPDTPNVITGIVKDPRGNILPSILVEVKDKEGNPVRAFKTNPLGQFASATPLVPGSYTIELEDPKGQQKFDAIQILVNNEILLPIEIISHDAREQLRKELFN